MECKLKIEVGQECYCPDGLGVIKHIDKNTDTNEVQVYVETFSPYLNQYWPIDKLSPKNFTPVKKSNLNNWIYIYYIKDDNLIYDRTVSRAGLGPMRAKQVIKQWEDKGFESFYTIGTLTRIEALS